MKQTSPPHPPPLTPQPPRGNWWQRNWTWFVPTGCLTFIALGVLFVVCIVFFVFSVLKSSDAYKTALARAKTDQPIVAALRTPIRDALVPSANTNINSPSAVAHTA